MFLGRFSCFYWFLAYLTLRSVLKKIPQAFPSAKKQLDLFALLRAVFYVRTSKFSFIEPIKLEKIAANVK